MSRASPMQTSYNAGEFSPVMGGRVDYERTRIAVATCSNMQLLLQGPATRRTGSRRVANTKGNAAARLLADPAARAARGP